MRPTFSNFSTRSQLIRDQALLGRRGVKRVLKKWASTRPSWPSTQPKASAQSIASDLLIVGSGAPSLANLSQAPDDVAACSLSQCSSDAASVKVSRGRSSLGTLDSYGIYGAAKSNALN